MTPSRLLRNTSAGVVAAIAAAASYTHMRTLAAEHGQSAPIAAMVPISVDGLMVVATIAMHDDKQAGQRVRRSAWAAFIVGVLASVTANVLSAPDDLTARVISAWPAVALLLVVELLARGGRTSEATDRADRETARTETADRADRAEHAESPDRTTYAPTGPGSTRTRQAERTGTAPADRNTARKSGADRRTTESDATRALPAPAAPADRTGSGPDVSDLIGPGRTVRDRLASQGHDLTRRALIDGLRADEHTVSTARASTLLRHLTAEPHPAPDITSEENTGERDTDAA